MFHLPHDFHMWFVIALTVWAAVSYVRERVPIEVTSVIVLTALLLFGQLFPMPNSSGRNMLDGAALLAGFSNPALVAVLALLVMGQAIIHTDALRPVIRLLVTSRQNMARVSVFMILLFVLVLSAFMNNTPLVVLAIPVMQALASESGIPESRLMMPLSFAAILGGMTTLIGSSTNMLVSSAMLELGYKPLNFFDFTVPGTILAAIGFLYVLIVLPRLVPARGASTKEPADGGKQFVAELNVVATSKLAGEVFVDGGLSSMPGVSIRLIHRAGQSIFPPFERCSVQSGDILIMGATTELLMGVLSRHAEHLLPVGNEEFTAGEVQGTDVSEKKPPIDLDERAADIRVLAEVMVVPGSRMIDMTTEQAAVYLESGTVILGVQRRARVLQRPGRIRLEAGDVLLVSGSRRSIDAMRGNQDVIVLSGSKKEIPVPQKAPLASGIMAAVIGLAALGVLSIPVASITGAVLLIATDCINIRQALRAVDRKIFLLVGSMLALGTALQVTGGARFMAESILAMPFLDTPFAVASALFLIVAILTNILSNNACAILFTPIAMSMATNLHADPVVFAITVIFAANCSFASPIGYKTNLLVMGPGRYMFRDFLKAGLPLVLLMWVSFMALAKYHFGL